MSCKFSEILIGRIVDYFQKYHSLVISDDQADEWLNSLADLFYIFDSMKKDK